MAGRLSIEDYPIEAEADALASEIGYKVKDEVIKKGAELAMEDRRSSVGYDDVKNAYQELFVGEIPK